MSSELPEHAAPVAADETGGEDVLPTIDVGSQQDAAAGHDEQQEPAGLAPDEAEEQEDQEDLPRRIPLQWRDEPSAGDDPLEEDELPRRVTFPNLYDVSARREDPEGDEEPARETEDQVPATELTSQDDLTGAPSPADADDEAEPPGVLVARGFRADVTDPAAFGGRHESPEQAAPDPRDSEWREIKSGFVDDPLASVQLGFGLVEAAIADLEATVRQRHESLAAKSGDLGGGADTEELRVALLSYREFANELGRMSDRLRLGGSPPPAHWASAIFRQ